MFTIIFFLYFLTTRDFSSILKSAVLIFVPFKESISTGVTSTKFSSFIVSEQLEYSSDHSCLDHLSGAVGRKYGEILKQILHFTDNACFLVQSEYTV